MLPPKLLYDAQGSALFEQITKLPEYYPTRTEAAILTDTCGGNMLTARPEVSVSEFGAGTATKTESCCARCCSVNTASIIFLWMSPTAALQIGKRRAGVRTHGRKCASPASETLKTSRFSTASSPAPGFIHWLEYRQSGKEEAISLLRNIAQPFIQREISCCLGVDLVKDSEILHAAYNDSAGITASFNKNLLVRINRELGGHFEPDTFSHVSFWNQTRIADRNAPRKQLFPNP